MKASDIVVAADIHVAQVWDDLSGYTSGRSLNPNEELRKLVRSLSKRQLLVLNGDLVDYYYADYLPKKRTNWTLFHKIVKGCRSRYLLNLGNHDYRAWAYNFSIYKLRHVAVPDETLKRIAGKLGFSRFRWLKELNSIRVNRKWTETAPAAGQELPYSFPNGDQQLIFLDTGPDALTRFRNLIDIRRWKQLFTIHPSSEGISDDSISFLKRRLASKPRETVIFLHCPPFFSKKKTKPFRIRKKHHTMRKKLTFGTFLKNNLEFLNTIMECEHNVILVTSHVHIPKQYSIDKETRTVKEVTIDQINKDRENPKVIKMLSTLPLGAIGRGNRRIGTLNIGKRIDYEIIREFKT